jgi:hypothetical protein
VTRTTLETQDIEALAAAALRRRRLEQMLGLAIAYRKCTRKELARILGRDPTKLVPGTGIPKLDFVVELATVLDWPVGDVVDYLWAPAGGDGHEPHAPTTAATHIREARRYRDDGRYREIVSSVTRCLAEPDISPAQRRALQAVLADAYYALWSLVEAMAIARDLLNAYRASPPQTRQDKRTHAIALYLAGQTQRRMMFCEPRRTRPLGKAARGDLEAALVLCRRLSLDRDDPELEGMADTCVGAMIETDVAVGACRPLDGLDKLMAGLEHVRDTTSFSAERLESYGWWCIYGCNIALRHLDDERALQQHMAIFTNKADEISNLLDDWPMRERVFTMQHTRWERAIGSTGFEIPVIIDSDDVRIITGAMGRFPFFKDTGWQILRTAQIIE